MARAGGRRDLGSKDGPRVQLTYDVEIGGELQRRELPFVIGVLGDFSGRPDGSIGKLRDRQFVEISKENFDLVLRSMRPRLVFKVDNKLTGDDSQLGIELRFQSLADFEPERVAMQVEPLHRLIAARQKLAKLRAAVCQSAGLDEGSRGPTQRATVDDTVLSTEGTRR